MKTINNNMTLSDFDAWSGAVDTKKTIINQGKEEEFNDLMEELYPDGLTETGLNDLLWFSDDWVYEMLEIEEE